MAQAAVGPYHTRGIFFYTLPPLQLGIPAAPSRLSERIGDLEYTPSSGGREVATIEFVNWLFSRTLQHRIFWERHPHMVSAALDSLKVQFVTSFSTNGEEAWRLFVICDNEGEQVYRATDTSAANGSLPTAPLIDSLFIAATEQTPLGQTGGPALKINEMRL